MNTSRLAHWGGATLSATACFAVFGFAYFAVPNSSPAPKPSLNKAESSVGSDLLAAYAKRTAKSCEPIAPIQTELRFESNPVPGIAAVLNLDVMTMEVGPNAEIVFDVPKGITVVTGDRRSTGTMAANQPYRFSVAVRFDVPGKYEIAAQAIVGESNYRFGRREKLYAEFDGAAITISDTPPARSADPDQAPKKGAPGPIAPPRHNYSLPPAIDPSGNPVGGTEGSDTTVTGFWRYRHTDGSLHAGYGSNVQAWDADSPDADDFLGVAAVAADGSYSINFDNDSDTGSTADVYLTFRSTNGEVVVHNAPNNVYETSTGVLQNDITNGTHDLGSWYADWGTNGTSDNNERAFQICDDATTAWAKGFFDLGHDPHSTSIEWYMGSTDGSYYSRDENRIYFEDSDVSSPDVLMHEYGHSFQDSIYGDTYWPPGTGGPHSFTGHYTTGLALTEGYGTYYSCIAQGDDWIYNSYDPANLITFDCDSNWDGNGAANGNSDGGSTGGNTGYDTESAVLSFLLDIDDARNSATDPYDWMAMDDDEIQDVFLNYLPGGHNPYTITEFFQGYHARGHAYLPKINGLMYVHGMPQGLSYPTIGLYSGISLFSSTAYYGGYGRGSFYIKNYQSNTQSLGNVWSWLRDPASNSIVGIEGTQYGASSPGTLDSGDTYQVFQSASQTGYNPTSPAFVYGAYTVTAGFYDSSNTWRVLQPAEPSTDAVVTQNVIEDTDGPVSCTVVDDGVYQTSTTSIHIVANSDDSDSSIEGYWTSVGTSAGASDVAGWVFHDANNDTSFDYTIGGLALTEGTTYYVNVYSRNIEGLLSPLASTNGITVNRILFPATFTLGPGSTISGGIGNLTVSNDARWNIRPTAILVSTQDPIVLTLEATCPYATLSDLDIQIESRATTANIVEKLMVYNWDTASYTTIDTRTLSTTDATFTDDPGATAPFIDDATGKVRMRLTFKNSAAVLTYPWQAQLDYVAWIMTQ